MMKNHRTWLEIVTFYSLNSFVQVSNERGRFEKENYASLSIPHASRGFAPARTFQFSELHGLDFAN